METENLSVVSDDREEGEIVDDDFEDISDNSIIIPIYSGKSVSPKEHLPAISLSSVTEVDEPKSEEKIRHRQKSRRRNSKTLKRRRNSHRKSASYSDSDSDDYVELNRKLQNQLKAAIRVNDIEETHKNSLRSRLRAMTKLDHDSDNSVEKNDNNEKVEQKESSDEGDSELTQLRLEALRTAVLNKFMHRKKRKMKEVQDNDVLSDISFKTDTSETNKENNHNTNENVNVRLDESPKKLCTEKPVEQIESKIEITNNIVIENNTPPEDDEDVLRALLLASMSKKITNETETKKTVVPPTNRNNVKQTRPTNTEVKTFTVKNVTQFTNRVVKNNVLTKNPTVQIPQVKPLIINVNGDSDSDEETFTKTKNNTPTVGVTRKPVDLAIESTVEKFLKEQRAKVEAQLPPVVKDPPKVNNCGIPDISSVKLLPEVKQIEYRKLLQKLKNAEKKATTRIRRLSTRYTADGKAIGNTSKKLIRTKVIVNKPAVPPKSEQLPDIRTEARTLHKMLKEMQIERNGRLQIHQKYKILMPIVKKINDVSVERKKCDDEVKRLLEELAEAKKRLLTCQQNFSAHVKELIGKKEDIDKSQKNPKPKPVEEPKVAQFTSTPIKGKPPPVESFEMNPEPTLTPDLTVITSKNVVASVPEAPLMAVEEEDVVDTPLNPGDPNDIDKIYSREKSGMPKYISPLDNVKREAADDPFSIVCPYDVDGNCRDPECVYKHLPN